MAEIYGTQDKAPAPAADNRSPLWAPAAITFQGQQWTQVGARYNGGSSLRPWKEGELRLPFKFDYELLEAAGLPSLRSTPYAIVLEDV